MKMWFYRAVDEDGRFLAESRSELQLITKVRSKYGPINFRIIKYWKL